MRDEGWLETFAYQTVLYRLFVLHNWSEKIKLIHAYSQGSPLDSLQHYAFYLLETLKFLELGPAALKKSGSVSMNEWVTTVKK